MFPLLPATSSNLFFLFFYISLRVLHPPPPSHPPNSSSSSSSSPTCVPSCSSSSPSYVFLTGSDFLKRPLEQYVRRLEIPVRVVRMDQRSGLIRARLKGASLSTGQVCDMPHMLHTVLEKLP